jgi:PST family polysaccharide transporter
LTKKEKAVARFFLFSLTAMAFSGVLFGYIDTIILGRFVSAEFIGYYQIALNLVASAAAVIAFSTVLLPIFSRLRGSRLQSALKKSARVTFLLSLAAAVLVFALAPQIVSVLFGNQYITSVYILRIFCLFLLMHPLSMVYSSFLISKGNPDKIAKVLVFSAILNVVLNIISILVLIKYGFFYATIGAAVSTVISRYFYLFNLIYLVKKS